tara:strand:- start:342 stop:455 length:114 start_codon:yes stop_codon:yes gene_type:complete
VSKKVWTDVGVNKKLNYYFRAENSALIFLMIYKKIHE